MHITVINVSKIPPEVKAKHAFFLYLKQFSFIRLAD